MQAAASLSFTAPLPLKSTKNLLPRRVISNPHRTVVPHRSIAVVAATPETLTVDYSSSTSVFPAEACDTVGGEACEVEMFPEVKPASQANSARANLATEEVDREYVEYNEPKTVFPGEACDDLGGEFCEPEYQEGVYKEEPLKN